MTSRPAFGQKEVSDVELVVKQNMSPLPLVARKKELEHSQGPNSAGEEPPTPNLVLRGRKCNRVSSGGLYSRPVLGWSETFGYEPIAA